MPHLILEYSANLEGQIDVPDLVRTVHDAALATGIFPQAGTRTRAAKRTEYAIADHDPGNGFVHLTLRIGMGRSVEVRQQAGNQIFEALTGALQERYSAGRLAISFEMIEINADTSWKQNNIHNAMAAEAGAAAE
ncbi:MAG: 5-carboxymethyl-2-hydroxymuconate Delta-isomerase [Pseudomonadota bacterium]